MRRRRRRIPLTPTSNRRPRVRHRFRRANCGHAYLAVNNIEVIYDHVILVVLKGVSLHVPEGKIVTLLGANGAARRRR